MLGGDWDEWVILKWEHFLTFDKDVCTRVGSLDEESINDFMSNQDYDEQLRKIQHFTYHPGSLIPACLP